MTKDEARSAVMGAISMALKDPILQQGFEIICKNLAELEKENAELRKSCDETQELLDKQIEATYNLDKENAELKETVIKMNKVITETFSNLTKAKELLKKLKALYFSPVVTKDDVKRQDEILVEVEQFLSEEVEK